jgi:hypothetical protein
LTFLYFAAWDVEYGIMCKKNFFSSTMFFRNGGRKKINGREISFLERIYLRQKNTFKGAFLLKLERKNVSKTVNKY